MIHSMTGFGRSEVNANDKLVSIEIKALNSKGLDINVRMPGYIREKEIELRNLISKHLKRGKVDVYFNVELPENKRVHTINTELARNYAVSIKSLSHDLDEKPEDLIRLVLGMPNVLEPVQEELNEDEWNMMLSCAQDAIDKVVAFRKQEGKKLDGDVVACLEEIEKHLEEIKPLEKERIKAMKDKINGNLEQMNGRVDFDKNRFEQELFYYMEKLDVSEEKSRLSSHINYFREILHDDKELKGKRLGFVSQEIGREINTLGSKANHAKIQQIVVNMKDHLEKIKEQLANAL